MKIQTRGFGLNVPTIVLIVLCAALLSGAFTFLRPVVQNDTGEHSVAGAVWPCKPSYWRAKNISWTHGGPLWDVTVRARLEYNGCDVKVTPNSQTCSWRGFGYAISFSHCTNYRVNLSTAYGQNAIVYSRFQLSVLWSGFPIGTSVLMCSRYDRWGNLIGRANGPYYSGC